MKVEILESTLMAPSEELPKRRLWISNLDLSTARNHTPIVYFYRANGDPSFFSVETLKKALGKALVPFFPLAGRLSGDGRLEIDCNNEGALFVVARADFTGECFDSFEPSREMTSLFVPSEDSAGPLALLQVTFMKCGSLALGTSIHHIVVDGPSVMHFMRTWTGIARGLDAAAAAANPLPYHDRTLLRARSPLVVPFPHIEYSCDGLPTAAPTTSVARIFSLSTAQIAALKQRCVAPGGAAFSTYCTLAAHLWICMCAARGLSPDSEARLIVPVNARRHLQPALPDHYFGNAIVRAITIVKVRDILSNPVSFAAKKIKDAIDGVDDEYVRSAIDFLELAEKKERMAPPGQVPETDLRVISWLTMPMHDADFGWGNPQFVTRLDMPSSGYVHLVANGPSKDDGVSVILGLKPAQTDCFKNLFYQGI